MLTYLLNAVHCYAVIFSNICFECILSLLQCSLALYQRTSVPGTVRCNLWLRWRQIGGRLSATAGGDNKLSADKELNCQWSDKHQPLTVDTDLFWQIIWQTSTKKQGARPVEIDKNRVKADCWYHKFCFRKTISYAGLLYSLFAERLPKS